MNLLFPYSQKSMIEISSARCIYVLKLLIHLVQISVWDILWSGFNEIISHFLYALQQE